jgi:hypothetical protein
MLHHRTSVLTTKTMQTNEIEAHERTDARTRRAATKSMTTHLEAPGLIRVYTCSGDGQDGYLVDAIEGVCECPAFRYQDGKCKHICRVEMELGEREIPDLPGRSDVEMMIASRQEAI